MTRFKLPGPGPGDKKFADIFSRFDSDHKCARQTDKRAITGYKSRLNVMHRAYARGICLN